MTFLIWFFKNIHSIFARIQRNIIEAAEIHAETKELDKDIEKLQSELNQLTKNLSPELLAQIEQGYFDLDSDDNEGDEPDDEGEKLNSTLKKNLNRKNYW